MSKLLRYSLETDRTVLLSFSDASDVRVTLDRVKKYVEPTELKKIEKAFRIRENFFKRHLPKFAVSIVAGGLLVAGNFHENTVLNHLFHPSSNVVPVSSAAESKKNVLPVRSPSLPSKAVSSQAHEAPKMQPFPVPNESSSQSRKRIHLKLQLPHIPNPLPKNTEDAKLS